MTAADTSRAAPKWSTWMCYDCADKEEDRWQKRLRCASGSRYEQSRHVRCDRCISLGGRDVQYALCCLMEPKP